MEHIWGTFYLVVFNVILGSCGANCLKMTMMTCDSKTGDT